MEASSLHPWLDEEAKLAEGKGERELFCPRPLLFCVSCPNFCAGVAAAVLPLHPSVLFLFLWRWWWERRSGNKVGGVGGGEGGGETLISGA